MAQQDDWIQFPSWNWKIGHWSSSINISVTRKSTTILRQPFWCILYSSINTHHILSIKDRRRGNRAIQLKVVQNNHGLGVKSMVPPPSYNNILGRTLVQLRRKINHKWRKLEKKNIIFLQYQWKYWQSTFIQILTLILKNKYKN